ncbi:MAG: hypothetical protein ACLQQ4_04980 [Bacteroidia bacterium]
MSIHKKWSCYTKKNAQSEPDNFGVYEIGDIDTGAILYIGEGKIRTGLLAHSPDGGRNKHVSVFGSSVVGNYGYRYELTGTKEKARQIRAKYLKLFRKTYGSLPRFNQSQSEVTASEVGL